MFSCWVHIYVNFISPKMSRYWNMHYYSALVGVWSIVINQSVCLYVCLCVCLSVCPRACLSGTAGPIFTKFCVWISCDRDSILLWRPCATLCTSGFTDDVTFGRNGPYAETLELHQREATTTSGIAIPGWSLMSMNACIVFVSSQYSKNTVRQWYAR